MGGEIWVEDGPNGQGSAFKFVARMQAADELPVLSPESSMPGDLRLQILLTEDNPVNQLVAIRLLEKLGHIVSLARNGREAVDAVATKEYDLLLMDLNMPVMDGLEATAAIRAQERGTVRHTTIIAMTANASRTDENLCLEVGMDGFLTKPVNSAKLRTAIETVSREKHELALHHTV
jgi:CheY-like chemotaxis protein